MAQLLGQLGVFLTWISAMNCQRASGYCARAVTTPSQQSAAVRAAQPAGGRCALTCTLTQTSSPASVRAVCACPMEALPT
jgi:hypothetical protein